MNKLDEFKEFVRERPILIKYVKNNEVTWQQFYEMYDLYGSENSIWEEYLKEEVTSVSNKVPTSLNDLFNMAKNLDVNKIQSGISSIQKALGLVGDLFVNGKNDNTPNDTYEPRPLYRHFED